MKGSIATAVRAMSPPRYTTAEVATRIGKSEDTIRRWREKGWLTPSDSRAFGSVVVPLYTDEDVKAGGELAKSIKPGRKPRD